MHGDDEPYGSVHRVELFDKWPRRAQITDNVGIMNRAATEDVRSPVWPVVSKVLHGGRRPSARDQQVVDILDDWVGRDAPRLDADGNGLYDESGPGDHGRGLAADRRRGDVAGVHRQPARRPQQRPRPRRPLGRVLRRQGPAHAARSNGCEGRFNLSYCGNGSLAACRASLWDGDPLRAPTASAAQFGTSDPTKWLRPRRPTGFAPGLLPNRFPTTNRPTFQQVLEFQNPWSHWGWGH